MKKFLLFPPEVAVDLDVFEELVTKSNRDIAVSNPLPALAPSSLRRWRGIHLTTISQKPSYNHKVWLASYNLKIIIQSRIFTIILPSCHKILQYYFSAVLLL